jgi:3-isopropylmalate/(R)-2-methylmalate dehydratase small subunit
MGTVWKFGDNLNTDEIIPGRFNITIDPLELAKNVFCEIKPDFAENVKPGDVIIGGQNFGCGSSREHAPIAIKGSQVKCIIAPSYARIFYRNAINIGLPIFECAETAENIDEGDDVDVDIATGMINNKTKGQIYQANTLPEFLLKIVESGGIISFLKDHDIQDLMT